MPESKPMESRGCADDPGARTEISAHQSGECLKFVQALPISSIGVPDLIRDQPADPDCMERSSRPVKRELINQSAHVLPKRPLRGRPRKASAASQNGNVAMRMLSALGAVAMAVLVFGSFASAVTPAQQAEADSICRKAYGKGFRKAVYVKKEVADCLDHGSTLTELRAIGIKGCAKRKMAFRSFEIISRGNVRFACKPL